MSLKPNSEDLVKFLLRFTTGGLMLFHGFTKVLHGIGRIYIYLEQAGLPRWLGPGVYVGEILAPLLLIFGVFTRSAAWILALTMVFTIDLGFRDSIFTLNQFGGWNIELNVLYLVNAVAIALVGGGNYSFQK
jgi:putative oxidoreductase